MGKKGKDKSQVKPKVKFSEDQKLSRTRAYAARAFGTETSKRLLLIGVLGLVLIVVSIVCIINKNKEKNTAEPQLGEYYVKQLGCSQDADCPDNTFCDGMGLCVTTDLLPLPSSREVLGRGRAAEGKTTKASIRNQGQKGSD